MAVAGKVAITPKGEWNANTAYTKLDLVFYNNASYVAIQPSTGVTPTNTSYWMLVLQSAGEADFDELVERINNIQTTSKGTLSTAGWWRFAKYEANTTSGNRANSCDIRIRKSYKAHRPEYHHIKLISVNVDDVYASQSFVSVASKSNRHHLTKIRHVTEGTTAYLEVYASAAPLSDTFFELSHVKDANFCWQAITPTLTEEEVEGVTVTTTYDIPANASPVTDLDLAQVDGTTLLNTSILEKALTLEAGVYQFKLAGNKYTGNDLPHADYKYGNATVYVWDKESNILVALWGTAYVTTPTAMQFYGNNGWRSNWVINTTTADLTAELAKYLALTGGTVEGHVRVSADNYQPMMVKNKNSGGAAYSAYENGDGYLGFLGFNSKNKPTFKNAEQTANYDLLHTGNISDYITTDTEVGTFDLTVGTATLSGYKYTKIGKFVYLSGTVSYNGDLLDLSSGVEVIGLPFAMNSIPYLYFGTDVYVASNVGTNNLANYIGSTLSTTFRIGKSGASLADGAPCVLHAMYITD